MRNEILGAVAVMLIAFSLCHGLPQEAPVAEAAHTAREQKKNRTIQENSISPKEISGETESLRNKLEQQAAQINELQRSLQRQADLIERQQQLLEALQQKAEQAGTPTITPAVLHESLPVVAAKAAKEKTVSEAVPKTPQNVESGYGKIRFNGLFHGWYAAGDGGFQNTFRLRRLELKFSGQITPMTKWTVMLEPTKGLSLNNTFTTISGTRAVGDVSVNQGSRILQDAFLTFDFNKNLHMDLGQHKIPLSLEGVQSGGTLETVERTMFASDRARGGNFGDVRDLGVSFRGGFTSRVDYQVGLFNGSGESQNDVDKDNHKAVIGRVVLRPPILKGLQVGGSGVWGNGSTPSRQRRDRLGTELLFVRGPFRFKSELMTGKDADFHRRGYYTLGAYKIKPQIEAVYRFDVWDPDRRFETNAANVTETDHVAGINYYIRENNLKMQFNYLRRTFQNGIVPSKNLFLINLQTSW